MVQKHSVQLRGWDYPHIDYSRPPERGNEWVGQEYDWDQHIECWRLYRSGLFVHYFPIHGDWKDHSRFWSTERGWSWGEEINYLSTIYSFVEIFEFAARLAMSPAGACHIRVEIELERLTGRRLTTTDDDIAMFEDYHTDMPAWKHPWEGTQAELIAKPRELAAVAAREFCARFGLDISLEILRSLQQKMAR